MDSSQDINTEAEVATPTDGAKVSFADYAFEMGKANGATANAMRVLLGVKKSEMSTAMFSRADLEKAKSDLMGRPAKPDKKAKA
jgi:hypothetical protein